MHSHPKQTRPARLASLEAGRTERSDDANAFLPDPTSRNRHNALADSDVESFAEEFIASATTGEPVEMDAGDEVIEEEWGGPFLELEGEEGEEGEGQPSMEERRERGNRAIPEPPALHKLPPRLH